MPFFRESFDGDDVRRPVPAAETLSRPFPIQGLAQLTRQALAGRLSRRTSEESIRTDLCDGPVPDALGVPESMSPRPGLCATTTSDRAELIERLKKGESPTWIPNRRHDSFFPRDGSRDHPPSSPRPESRGSPVLLTTSTANHGMDGKHDEEAEDTERTAAGLSIERPRSALHSGDFTQHRYDGTEKQDRGIPEAESYTPDRSSAWFATSPPRGFTRFKFESRTPLPDPAPEYRSPPPSLSSSLSSSFVFKHPTSPLVQSESNDDLKADVMELDPGTPSRMPRRQTLHTFHSSQNMPITAQRIPTMRRETTFPYQAHQPRKSLTSAPPAWPFLASSPQKISPYAVTRRPSVALDSSPLQKTSMVGSYEESILRGRMSTTPSKPLDFLAQIGVLGLGNCKGSLRCPAHVTLPFPAVFYSYASTPHGRSSSDDGPSPYVGSIDLENGLPNLEESRARRRSGQRSGRQPRAGSVGPDVEMSGVDVSGPDAREIAKYRRRTGSSPKAPPGGSYRIPEKGQLQIIIKNQNKTAVKLFLVPYDLAGMEPGTKTFIRQRAYSGGPVVDGAPGAAARPADEKPVLRYLVHLHICCPAKGRYYLYKSVRVVFANRVPDGKEKLRNEITLPEPRFTPYKALRASVVQPSSSSGPGASLAFSGGRRTSGFWFGGGGRALAGEPVPDLPSSFELRRRAASVQGRGGALGRPASGYALLSFAKGEVSGGAAGTAVSLGSAAAAESLLSQRLRSLGMQGVCRGEMEETGDGAGGEKK